MHGPHAVRRDAPGLRRGDDPARQHRRSRRMSDGDLRLMEDVDFFARAIRRFGARFVDRVTLHYRIGPSLMRQGEIDQQVIRRAIAICMRASPSRAWLAGFLPAESVIPAAPPGSLMLQIESLPDLAALERLAPEWDALDCAAFHRVPPSPHRYGTFCGGPISGEDRKAVRRTRCAPSPFAMRMARSSPSRR